MSKLDELIKEYCSDGVEYKKLKEITTIKTGKGITKQDISSNGIYPIISGGKEPMGFIDFSNRKNNCVTVARAGTAGYVNFIKQDFYLNDKCFSVIPIDNNQLLSRYLFFALKNREEYIVYLKSKGSIPTINTQKLGNVIIPVPPLPLQKEIVRVLDILTGLTAELNAELDARKKQYEYYRDNLLNVPKNNSTQYLLSDIATIKNGKDYKHLSNGSYPVYGSGGIINYVNEYVYDKPSVLIPRKGSLSNLFYVDKPFWNVDTIFYTIIDQSKVSPKYFFYLLKKEHLEALNKAGGVPSLTQTMLNNIKHTIPSIEVQKKIVNVLDNFDAICSDLDIGLPAEISAREKQYQYYRDKLLSFNELRS